MIPDIVCTSSLIYDAVVKSYPQEKVYTIEGHNSIRIIKDPCGEIEALVFCSYHPSTPGTADKFHEGVMVHYRAFLKNVGLSRWQPTPLSRGLRAISWLENERGEAVSHASPLIH